MNKPASGTYGEGAALDRLKSQLPGESPDQASAVTPSPAPSGPAPIEPPAAGLPKSLFAPTRQPHIPAATPLSEPAEPAVGPSAELVKVAQLLLRSPTTSATTRSWARTVMEGLNERGAERAPAPAATAAPAAAY